MYFLLGWLAGIRPYSAVKYNSDRDYWKEWMSANFVLERIPGHFRKCSHGSPCVNVSVLFFDKSAEKSDDDKVVLVDASKLGKEYKDANGLKKIRLENDEIDKIVSAFRNAQPIDDFSAVVSYADVKAKGYSLSAGQYFDIKIDYVDITEDEFNAQMKADMDELESMFAESHRLEDELRLQLNRLKFGG